MLTMQQHTAEVTMTRRVDEESYTLRYPHLIVVRFRELKEFRAVYL